MIRLRKILNYFIFGGLFLLISLLTLLLFYSSSSHLSSINVLDSRLKSTDEFSDKIEILPSLKESPRDGHNHRFISSIQYQNLRKENILKQVETSNYKSISLPEAINTEISCKALFSGDSYEQHRAYKYMKLFPKVAKSDSEFGSMHCEQFLKERRYVTGSTSPEEEIFPIAFAITMFKDTDQFERLFRAIYRPQHLFCIHVDSKASQSVFDGVSKISQCLNSQFNNVIISSARADVVWGEFSVLEAELFCMRELWNHRQRRKWLYLINLTGQEFPLRTNLELVRILRILNGSNVLEGTTRRLNQERLGFGSPPHGLRLHKGSVHVVVSAGFVDFLLHDQRALDLLDFVRDHTQVPDEFYFSTLNHNPDVLPVPGAYTLEAETDPDTYPFIARFKNWGNYPFSYECGSGHWVRQICIWGIQDLPQLATRTELFANKFYWHFQPLALDCLEDWYWNRTRDDFETGPLGPRGDGASPAPSRIALSYYRALRIVKHHL